MKSRKTLLSSIVAIALALVVISCFLVVENVGSVKKIFSPMVIAVADSADSMDEWERLLFSDDDLGIKTKDYLIYDSVFWKKEIINTANNPNDILLRVTDESGNVVVDELLVSPGTNVQLESLRRNEKYYFEIKAEQGKFFINAR